MCLSWQNQSTTSYLYLSWQDNMRVRGTLYKNIKEQLMQSYGEIDSEVEDALTEYINKKLVNEIYTVYMKHEIENKLNVVSNISAK